MASAHLGSSQTVQPMSLLLNPNNSAALVTSSHRQSVACATAAIEATAKEAATQALTPETSDINIQGLPALSISSSTTPSSSNSLKQPQEIFRLRKRLGWCWF